MADIVPEKLLQTDEKVVNFIDDKRFKSTLPKECLRECLSSCASEYKKEVLQLLKIVLPHLSAGFSEKRSVLFGFGPKAHTGTLLKISSVTDEAKRRKLNRAATHNLNEGEKCEFHQLHDTYTGKQCLESASKKMIINKNIDLLETSEPVEIKKFRKPSK